MTLSSNSVVLSSLEFGSSDIASDVVGGGLGWLVGGGLVDTSFDVVGGIAIVVVFSSVMLSSVVVGGTEDDGVMGGVRG